MIRRAKAEDIPKIEDLLLQVLTVHHDKRPDLFKGNAKKYTHEQLVRIIEDDDRPVFVAVDGNDKVSGYVFCIFEQHIDDNILTDVKTLYIDDLCVDEGLRGHHIGKQLYEFALDYAKKCGCYNLTLNVWACNENAMRFYEECRLHVQKIHMEKILE